MPADSTRPRQRRKETRPQEFLDAALALFVEKGFAASRAEEVAQRAGVSKGTLYLYYPSKEDLFKAVVRQTLSSLIAEGVGIVASFQLLGIKRHEGLVEGAFGKEAAEHVGQPERHVECVRHRPRAEVGRHHQLTHQTRAA